MLDVQNRLPTPGKENRVKITQDSGAVVEGVLSYADDATQDGTFWNRKNGQLLQGDIRTYPVREGQSISAGDVVNVGREVLSGTTYGDLAVGSTVQINENGSPVDYLVVHQGNPDPNLYDASCDGTWLLRKDIAENRVWDAGNVNAYADSDINDYLNGGWLGRYDSTTLGNIKQVKIPYCVGNGSSTINSGANGLSVKAFFLGGSEVGWSSEDNQYFSADGAKLDFFMASDGKSANQKRIAALNGLASTYALRSPISDANGRILSVLSDGFCNGIMCQYSLGIRPCIIFDSAALLGDDIVYGPETVYKDVVAQDNVENVIYSTAVTNTHLASFGEKAYLCVDYGTASKNVQLSRLNDSYSANKASVMLANRVSTAQSYGLQAMGAKSISVSFESNGSHYVRFYAYSESSGSFTQTKSYSVSNAGPLCRLSDNSVLHIRNTSGLMVEVISTSQKYSETKLLNNTGANYIAACKLPDDSNGNKRVCICFADTGDGNKGKAVIATIDSSNAVTFGSVVTVLESPQTNIQTHCVVINGVILAQFWVYFFALSFDLNVLKRVSSPHVQTSNTALFSNGNYAICIGYSSSGDNTGNSGANIVRWNENDLSIDLSDKFVFNQNYLAYYPSGGFTIDNNFIVAYADAGNSNYGTTTILEVSGNQIAGSFLDNSKDAIALASGSGGDIIPVGFGGYCQCDGVTEGQEIISDGVSAFSPLDGWLYLLGEGMKRLGTQIQIVSYVGTGTYGESNPCSITANFPIKFALMIGYSQYQSNIMLTPGTMPTTFKGEHGFYINNDYSRSYGKTSVDKKTITWYSGSKTSQLNATNQTYQVLCVG